MNRETLKLREDRSIRLCVVCVQMCDPNVQNGQMGSNRREVSNYQELGGERLEVC